MQVRTQGIRKTYGSTVALNDTTFTVEDGEFVTLLGPSGCGKTTFLRIIAGFIKPGAGRVFIGDADITELQPHKRGIGMVFQNFALFPHMTVGKNVGYGLKVRGTNKAVIAQKVDECLTLVGLAGFQDRYPHQLSGGQQQRVAIARVLAIEPKVLLLDEPFGALDKKLRVQLQVELKKLINKLHITSLFVTHDQEEALIMSDRIAIMEAGNIVQCESPITIYDKPATEFVASFIGSSNILDATVKKLDDEYLTLCTEGAGEITAPHTGSFKAGEAVRVLIRPENFSFTAQEAGAAAMEGEVVFATHLGSYSDYEVRLSTGLTVKVNEHRSGGLSNHKVGDQVTVYIVNEHACAVYRK